MFSQVSDTLAIVRMNRITWGVIAAMLLALGIVYPAAGLTLEIGDGWGLLLAAPACLLVSLYYRYRRIDRYISTGAETGAQLVLILLLGVLLSYAAATANFAYRDAELHAADRWFGFDWRAYLDYFNTHFYLGYAAHIIYLSINLQPILVIFALTAAGQFLRLQQFVLATGLALCATITIFIFTPAVNNFAFHNLQQSDFANLSPTFSFDIAHHLEALRHATTYVVRLDGLDGLITFPSFHAVSALLFVWAAWPIRQLRWGICLLNLVMVAAIPVDGGHYLIDIVAGGVVAAIAVLATIRLQRPLLTVRSDALPKVSAPADEPAL